MTARDTLPDKRALGMMDVPYSAYCKVCWYPIWRGCIDRHKGGCIHGYTRAHDCEEAMNRAHDNGVLAKFKQKWLVK